MDDYLIDKDLFCGRRHTSKGIETLTIGLHGVESPCLALFSDIEQAEPFCESRGYKPFRVERGSMLVQFLRSALRSGVTHVGIDPWKGRTFVCTVEYFISEAERQTG